MNFYSDEEIENGENSEGGENEENQEVYDNENLEENNNIIKYKSSEYKLEDVLKKLQDLQIIKITLSIQSVKVIWHNNSYMDQYLWRYRKEGDNHHYSKINIRKKRKIEHT